MILRVFQAFIGVGDQSRSGVEKNHYIEEIIYKSFIPWVIGSICVVIAEPVALVVVQPSCGVVERRGADLEVQVRADHAEPGRINIILCLSRLDDYFITVGFLLSQVRYLFSTTS